MQVLHVGNRFANGDRLGAMVYAANTFAKLRQCWSFQPPTPPGSAIQTRMQPSFFDRKVLVHRLNRFFAASG
jgi:hypothetical protein